MRFNQLGQAIGRGHIDGVTLPDVGGTDYGWLLPDGVPICAAGNDILKYEGTWRSVFGPGEVPHGANFLRAGKGRWFSIPGFGDLAPADVDLYLGTAVLTRYSTGSDLILIELNGATQEIKTGPLGTDAIAFRNARQRNGWILYQTQTDGKWTLQPGPSGAKVPIAARAEGVDYAVPVSHNGKVLLLERASGRLTLRYPDTTMGWLVHEDLSATGLVVPDAISIGGIIRVSWSNDQSESARVYAVADVALDPTTRVDLNDRPATVAPYERALPQFYYFTYDAGRGYGNHPGAVLHCAWCATAADVAEANAAGQFVATAASLIDLATKKAYVLCANDYPNAPPMQTQVDEAVKKCRQHSINLIAYNERNDPVVMPPWTITAVRRYRVPGEPLQTYLNDAKALILAAPTAKVCFIAGVDDQKGALPEPAMRETAQATTDLWREQPRVEVGAWFSFARTGVDPATGQNIPPGGAILYPKVDAVVRASQNASNPVGFTFTPPSDGGGGTGGGGTGGGGGQPKPKPLAKGRAIMPADEIKGWLFDLAGANYFVDPGNPDQLQKHPAGQLPNPNWSGWEAVHLSEPGDGGRRAVIFDEAKRKLSEDNEGKPSVKGLDWNGDWELFMVAEQPEDWVVALVFRRHGQTIKNVYIFQKAK